MSPYDQNLSALLSACSAVFPFILECPEKDALADAMKNMEAVRFTPRWTAEEVDPEGHLEHVTTEVEWETDRRAAAGKDERRLFIKVYYDEALITGSPIKPQKSVFIPLYLIQELTSPMCDTPDVRGAFSVLTKLDSRAVGFYNLFQFYDQNHKLVDF